MSKRPARNPGQKPPVAQKSVKGASMEGGEACPPLERRPRLFAVLLIGFVIWLGVLLTLYFRTVYPMRYPSTDATTRPGASGLPSAPR
jgi:hypothetical protein